MGWIAQVGFYGSMRVQSSELETANTVQCVPRGERRRLRLADGATLLAVRILCGAGRGDVGDGGVAISACSRLSKM